MGDVLAALTGGQYLRVPVQSRGAVEFELPEAGEYLVLLKYAAVLGLGQVQIPVEVARRVVRGHGAEGSAPRVSERRLSAGGGAVSPSTSRGKDR